MNTHLHLEEFLQRDLNALERKISGMARIVDGAIGASLAALKENNRQKAYSVILRDQYIDELETEVDRLSLEFLVKHQPVAGHLRFVFAAIQINRELERVGDFAESVARQALTLSRLDPRPDFRRVAALAELARHMLTDAIQSFVKRDADLARRTVSIEERANAMRNEINVEIEELVRSGAIHPACLQPVQTIARRFEGVADQAKNICEEVLYMCTGEFTRHRGADTFRILFLDEFNSTLSQLAAAIGKNMHLPRFVFQSAGISARPVHPEVIKFLHSKGMDINPDASKTLEQVPEWEQSQVIITLNMGLPSALPSSSKAIHIKWAAARDLAPETSGAEAQAILQTAFEVIQTQIKELVGAVLEEEPKSA